MKKISWGTGIALLYLGFVAGILTLVTMSMNQRVDLVAEDYYAQELAFQSKIDRIARASELTEPLRWEVRDGAIYIQYPTTFNPAELAGTVHFYCPANNQKDLKIKVNANADLQQSIPLSDLQSGRYLIQFDWKNSATTYWNEGVISVK
jgi:hypothetical protein